MASPLQLKRLPGYFAIFRLDVGSPIPEWAAQGDFYSLTRTREELSIVCREANLPAGQPGQRGWRLLMVKGPLEFSLSGILASLTAPLAAAEIPIFSISTYDTDYLLVKDETWASTLTALQDAGHEIVESPESI